MTMRWPSPDRLDALLDDEEQVDYDFDPEPEQLAKAESALKDDPDSSSRQHDTSPAVGSSSPGLRVDAATEDVIETTEASASPGRVSSSPDQQADVAAEASHPNLRGSTAPTREQQGGERRRARSRERTAHQSAQDGADGKKPRSQEQPAQKPARGRDAGRSERSAHRPAHGRETGRPERSAHGREMARSQRRPAMAAEMEHRSERVKEDRKRAERPPRAQQTLRQQPPRVTRYFLLKSTSLENIEQSVARGIWATQVCSKSLERFRPLQARLQAFRAQLSSCTFHLMSLQISHACSPWPAVS